MTDKDAVHYMKITEGILLMALNDPGLNDEANLDLDKLIEAIDVGIKAIQMPMIYYINSKEGNDGKNET